MSIPRSKRAWLFLLALGLLPPLGLWAQAQNQWPITRHVLPTKGLSWLTSMARRGSSQQVRWVPWKDLVSKTEAGQAKEQEERAKALEKARAPTQIPLRFEGFSLQARQAKPEDPMQIEAETVLVVAKDGFFSVPLLGPGFTPTRFQLDTHPKLPKEPLAEIEADASGTHVLVRGPGSFPLRIFGLAPTHRDGYLSRCTLKIPPVPGARGKVDLPSVGLEVLMDPAPSTTTEEANGRTQASAVIPPGTPFQVHWFSKDAGLLEESPTDSEAELPSGLEVLGPLQRASWAHTLVLGRGSLDAKVRLDLKVFRQSVESLRFRIHGSPENLRCLTSDRRIASATQEGEDFVVRFRTPQKGRLPLDFSYRVRSPEGKPSFQVSVPSFELQGAFDQTSKFWIGRSTNVEVRARKTDGLEPLGEEGSEGFVLDARAQDPLLRYRSHGAAIDLALEVSRHPDAPSVATRLFDRIEATTRLTPQGKLATVVRGTLRNRSQAPLRVRLPEGATATEFRIAGARIHPPQEPDQSYLLDLKQEGRGQSAETLEVEFRYLLQQAKALGFRSRLDLPLARFQVPVLELDWTVVPPDETLVRIPGVTRAWSGSPQATQTRLLESREGWFYPRPLRIETASTRARHFEAFAKLAVGAALGSLGVALMSAWVSLGWLALFAGLAGVALLSGAGTSSLFLSAFATAFLLLGLVSLRRGFRVWLLRRRWRKVRQRALATSLPAFRSQLEALGRSLSPETPPPDADPGSTSQADSGEATSTPETKDKA